VEVSLASAYWMEPGSSDCQPSAGGGRLGATGGALLPLALSLEGTDVLAALSGKLPWALSSGSAWLLPLLAGVVVAPSSVPDSAAPSAASKPLPDDAWAAPAPPKANTQATSMDTIFMAATPGGTHSNSGYSQKAGRVSSRACVAMQHGRHHG
jgi:hypothetical protein